MKKRDVMIFHEITEISVRRSVTVIVQALSCMFFNLINEHYSLDNFVVLAYFKASVFLLFLLYV